MRGVISACAGAMFLLLAFAASTDKTKADAPAQRAATVDASAAARAPALPTAEELVRSLEHAAELYALGADAGDDAGTACAEVAARLEQSGAAHHIDAKKAATLETSREISTRPQLHERSTVALQRIAATTMACRGSARFDAVSATLAGDAGATEY